jgi:hypothetical protein
MSQDFDLLGAAPMDGDEYGVHRPLSHDTHRVRD